MERARRARRETDPDHGVSIVRRAAHVRATRFWRGLHTIQPDLWDAPTRYADLNRVLAEFVAGLQTVLGLNLYGAYLQGSFAVGDADEYSDVDFIVVTYDDLSLRPSEGRCSGCTHASSNWKRAGPSTWKARTSRSAVCAAWISRVLRSSTWTTACRS
jgi:Nucleotidyltransferase domain